MIQRHRIAAFGVAGWLLAMVGMCSPVAAAAEPTASMDPLMAKALSLQSQALDLRRGQYIWRDDVPNAGPVTIIVSVSLQRAYVFREMELVGVAAVSTGKPGHGTPRGEFEILQKRQFHRSNIYSNAPMPFMQRLTWTGIALHGGHDPGYPASHGCIRLPLAFARLLFGATVIGAEVSVVDDDVVAPPPPEERYVPTLVAMPDRLDGGVGDAVFARGWSVRGAPVTAQSPARPTPVPVPMIPYRAQPPARYIVSDAVFAAPRAELRVPDALE